MPVQTHAQLIEKIKLKDDIYHFKVKAPEIVKAAKPGISTFSEESKSGNPDQFVFKGTFHKRPLSAPSPTKNCF